MPMILRDIAAALSAPVSGDGGIEIAGIADPAHASGSDLALAMTRETVPALAHTKARAVVVAAKPAVAVDRFDGVIKVERPRETLAVLTRLFERRVHRGTGIHPSAVVAPDAQVDDAASIGPLSAIGPRARVGAGTVILAHVTVGADVVIGRDCLIHPGARIGDRVVIGDRVILQHNVSLGADGFSYAGPAPGERTAEQEIGDLVRINSLGTVILGDDVEVGANSAIDRATLAATRIGRNTKIDNLVQIGHNVSIGENCLICGMTGISGSVHIGDRVILAGAVGVADHVTIGSDAMIAAGSKLFSDVPAKGEMYGYPAVPRKRAFEQIKYLARARALFTEFGELKKRIAGIEQAKQG
jgi:UDP-3-O-[3-hydroxymyristoyl] glucosamine N-acyltransferase